MADEKKQTEQAGETKKDALLPADWEHHYPEDLNFFLDVMEDYVEMKSDYMHDLMAARMEQLQNSHGAAPQAEAQGPHQPDTLRADREQPQPARQQAQEPEQKGGVER